MTINPSKLSEEIIAAGIPISGCSSTGIVWGPDGITEIQNQPNVQAIIATHDPFDYVLQRQIGAESVAAAIPNWAGWSTLEWQTYYDANISTTQINAITNLADAKAMLNKLSNIINSIAKMEIALRNRVFPKLEDL